MSILPLGKSIRHFIPDSDEFRHDPSAYLKAKPIEIGPRRAYGLAGIFGAIGAGFLLACVVSGVWNDERLLLGIGMLIGASVWLGWSLRLRGHSLLLKAEGVEFRYFDSVVWCPWAVFNTDGEPIVPAGDNPRAGLILPVSPEALPFIELRRHDAAVAHGSQIRAAQFRITANRQAVLPGRYELDAVELGDFLLEMGGRLGWQTPAGTPPPEAYPTNDSHVPEIIGPDRGGWYTVPLSILKFPRRCCGCHQPTEVSLPVALSSDSPAGWSPGANTYLVQIPLCPDCRAAMRAAYQRSGWRGLNVGSVAGAVSLIVFMAARGLRSPPTLALAGLAGAVIGALLGFLAGCALTHPLPLQFRRYLPESGTVQVRFLDAGYADLVLSALQSKRLNS
jgi:hypothetical protein